MLPILRFFHHKMGIETSKHGSTFLPNIMDFGILENMLQDPSATPLCLPIVFLETITSNFSEEQELGRGAYGVVYKGKLQNGKMIAVKKLFEIQLEDDQFQNEVTYLFGVKHQNIVQLVGYCAESRWEATQVSGKYVLAEIRKRLLCFEYLQNNSLDKHLSAESSGLEWHMRYEIIRGVCCGLHHLHTECRIVHLDLEPQNILLDDDMVPKIADFGMSRLFGQQQSRIITNSRGGTLGYMAPEYITNGLISTKSDIFSLGVIIIELMTGCRDYPQISEAPFESFIENVIGNWRHTLEKTLRYTSLEICSQQVNRCIVVGLNCVDPDPKKRPSASDIIQTLNEVESTNWSFGKNEGPAMGQESQIVTFSDSCNENSSNLGTSFDKILSTTLISTSTNISTVFGFAPKGTKISILAFEVANTIVKASNLMNFLSKQLKKGVLRSEGVHRLISEDYSQLSILVEDDIREDLRRFSIEVGRFGNWCKGPEWHNLDRYYVFIRSKSELTYQKNSSEAAHTHMQYLIKLAERTSELHQELLTLDRLEQAYYVTATRNKKQRDVIKNQRGAVQVLKKKSLWRKNMEDIVEKLVEIMHFMHLEINNTFLKNHGEQSVKAANNLGQTLGPAGLALHYANVILQIKTLSVASPAVPDKAREALYEALPPRIKTVLHTQLRRRCPSREKTTTVAEVRAEMDRVLQWLVPAAESTRLYHLSGVFGEWAMKGMEGIDVDEANWFEQDSRISVSSMLGHADAKVSKIETLYHADKETTEGYILELVLALHRLVRPQARNDAQMNAVSKKRWDGASCLIFGVHSISDASNSSNTEGLSGRVFFFPVPAGNDLFLVKFLLLSRL